MIRKACKKWNKLYDFVFNSPTQFVQWIFQSIMYPRFLTKLSFVLWHGKLRKTRMSLWISFFDIMKVSHKTQSCTITNLVFKLFVVQTSRIHTLTYTRRNERTHRHTRTEYITWLGYMYAIQVYTIYTIVRFHACLKELCFSV